MNESGSIADRLAIRSLVDAYGDAVLRRDPVAWGETWAEDGYWELAGFEARGRAAIVALWVELIANYPFVVQFYSGAGLQLGETEGTGAWNLLEITQANDGAPATPMVSTYRDRYVKDAAGIWRFAERRWTLRYPLPAAG
jgi:hypothetical protein